MFAILARQGRRTLAVSFLALLALLARAGAAHANHCQVLLPPGSSIEQAANQDYPGKVICLQTGLYHEPEGTDIVSLVNTPGTVISVAEGATPLVQGGLDTRNGAVNDVPLGFLDRRTVAYFNNRADLMKTVAQISTHQVDLPPDMESALGRNLPFPNPPDSTRRIGQAARVGAQQATFVMSPDKGWSPERPFQVRKPFPITTPAVASESHDRDYIVLGPWQTWNGPAGVHGNYWAFDEVIQNPAPIGGVLMAPSGNRLPIGTENRAADGYYPGTSERGSGMSKPATTVRGVEALAGIYHPIQVSVATSALDGFIPPATKCDANCAQGGPYYYGERLALKPDWQPPLGVDTNLPFFRNLIAAVRDYGLIVADRGSNYELDFSRHGVSNDPAIPSDTPAYAAALGLPAGAPQGRVDAAMDHAIDALHLTPDVWDFVCTSETAQLGSRAPC